MLKLERLEKYRKKKSKRLVCEMVSVERLKEIQDYVMKLTLTECFGDPLFGASPDVLKRSVVGYLIIKTSDGRVISRPVCQSSDYIDDDFDLFEVCTFLYGGEELLGIVPATKMTFAVYGCLPEDNVSFEDYKAGKIDFGPDIFLGFEYEGMDHPDWIRVLKRELINKLVWNEKCLERNSRMKKIEAKEE